MIQNRLSLFRAAACCVFALLLLGAGESKLSEGDARIFMENYLSARASADAPALCALFEARNDEQKAVIKAFVGMECEERQLILAAAKAFPDEMPSQIGPSFVPVSDEIIKKLRDALKDLTVSTDGNHATISLHFGERALPIPMVMVEGKWLLDSYAFLHLGNPSTENVRLQIDRFNEETSIITAAVAAIGEHRIASMKDAMVSVEGKLNEVEVRAMEGVTTRQSTEGPASRPANP